MTDKSDRTVSGDTTREVRESSVGWVVKSLGIWLDKQMEIGLEPFGLSMGQFAIMMTLLERDGLMQVEISRQLSMPGSATTRNIDKLEELKYVKRRSHEASRRSNRIFIAEKGSEIAPDLYSLIKDVNERFLCSLSGKDKAAFRALLFDLHGHLISNQ